MAQKVSADPEFVSEVLKDTLDIGADCFRPFAQERRQRIRAVLYGLLDPMPAGANEDWLDQLLQDAFIPDEATRSALFSLAEELGDSLGELMIEFLGRVLGRIAEHVLDAVAEITEQAILQVQEWLGALEQVILQLGQRLLELPGEIAALAAEAAARLDEALGGIQEVLDAVATPVMLGKLREELATILVETAMTPLTSQAAYTALPLGVRSQARAALRDSVSDALAVLTEPLGLLMAPAAGEVDAVLDEIRELLGALRDVDPNADVTGQLSDWFLDRFESQARNWLGGDELSIPIGFSITFSVTPPKIPSGGYWTTSGRWVTTYTQPPAYSETVEFDLGTFSISLSRVLQEVRNAIGGLATFTALMRELTENMTAVFAAEDALVGAEAELTAVEIQHEFAHQELAASRAGAIDVTIVEPSPAALYEGDLEVEILFHGVPESFLGLGELQAERVFVYLNEAVLPSSRFHLEALDSGRRSELRSPGEAVGLWGSPSARKMQRQHEGADAAKGPSASASGLPKRQSVGVRPPRADNLAGRLGSVRRSSGRDQAIGIDARFAGEWDLQSMGKKRSEDQRREIREQAGEALRLRIPVPLRELRLGINTLSVAVVDGRNQRVEQTVSFIASEPELRKLPVRLPEPPKIVSGLPDVVLIAMKLAEETADEPGPASKRRPQRDGDPLWLPPRAERKKQGRKQQGDLAARQDQVKKRLLALRQSVARGELRPGFRPNDCKMTKS